MAQRLEGIELRVFRSLLREWDRDTVDAVRIELTRGQVESYEGVAEAVRSLVDAGYVREHAPEHFCISGNGLAVQGSLLGETARA